MRAAASASAWSLDGAGMGGAVVMRCFCCFFLCRLEEEKKMILCLEDVASP